MALVGNISGSSSQVGITGSVIFANRSDSLFPGSLPGADVVFFVSGSRESKGGSERTVAVFGGDTVISGNLTVGTGSVTITSNEIQFLGGMKIHSTSNGLTFVDSSGTTTLSALSAGSGGSNFFTASTDKVIYNSGSVAFTGDRTGADSSVTAASDKGADVQFYFSGSNSAVAANRRIALFGGGVISSGSIRATDGTNAAAILQTGVISGSGNLMAGGDLSVAGTATITGLATLNAGAVINGDLTVRGTTTTLSSSNLTISDPVILIGSGATSTQSNSMIAFASGSTTAATDLVFGAKSGILVAAQYNTTGGNLPYADISTKALIDANLVGIKAKQFFVYGDNAGISAANSNDILVSGSATGAVQLGHGSGRDIQFYSDSTNYLKFNYQSGASQVTVDATSKKLLLSGTQVVLQTSGTSGTEGVSFTQTIGATSQEFIRFTSSSADGGSIYSNGTLTLSAGVSSGDVMVKAQGGNVRLGIAGTSSQVRVEIGANMVMGMYSGSVSSTYNNVATVRSADTKSLVISGSTDLIFGAGSSGGAANFVARIGTEGSRSGFFPASDKATQEFDLGAPTKRWANIYTGDLHLRNERGDYTLIEESDSLTIRYNKTGKRYRILVERAPEYDG